MGILKNGNSTVKENGVTKKNGDLPLAIMDGCIQEEDDDDEELHNDGKEESHKQYFNDEVTVELQAMPKKTGMSTKFHITLD